MDTVKISPKYQVVIPKAIRESLQLESGQCMQVIEYNDRIELVPAKNIADMLGFLKGITTEVNRESDRL
jgi:AbrB family looped-hinge helix DNA binding protein